MILVSSMGGCASTSLVSWISKRIDCNCPVNSEGLKQPGPGSNPLGLKHRITPPQNDDPYIPNGATIEKAIFVFDTPLNIIPSLFRRNIACGHAIAVSGAKPTHQNNFDEFIKLGEDSFSFASQFANWSDTSVSVGYPRLLIRFSKLWEYLPLALQFLEIDLAEAKNFPKKQQRASSPSQLGWEDFNRLSKIYHNLNAEINRAPDFFII